MKFGLTDKELENIINVFHKFPQIKKAYIIGSRATGTFSRTSDIDLVISAPQLSFDDFLSVKVMMNKLPIIYSIDVIHLERVNDEDLREEIEKTKQLIYTE